MKIIKLFLALLIVAGVVAALMAWPYISQKAKHETIVRIPENADRRTVSDTLARYLGRDYAEATVKIMELIHTDFPSRHGAYLIKEGEHPLNAARTLARGAQTPVTVTINGVREFWPFTSRIASKFEFSQADLEAVLSNPHVSARYGLTPEQIPSLFLNDSYYFYWTSTPEEVVEKVGRHYNDFWDNDRKAKAAALGLSPAQIITIASITEEETNDIQERGTVGRLYINRLKAGMRLQADPTVKFALKDFGLKRIRAEHLKAPGPYNTYRYAGLPPGPIRTVSASTVDAILNAPAHNYYYMCAKEDFSGRHNFAESFDQHRRNALRYQQALNSRNIH